MKDFEKIGDVVGRVVARLSADRTSEFRQIWEESVDADMLRHTTPVSYEDGRLTILVDNSVYLQELILEREKIRARLNSFPSGKRVSEIKFKMGYTQE